MIGSTFPENNTALIEKLNLALAGLEKLRTEIASVETRYTVLTGDYSRICDEALLKINSIRSTVDIDCVNTRPVTYKPIASFSASVHIKAKYSKNIGGEGMPTHFKKVL